VCKRERERGREREKERERKREREREKEIERAMKREREREYLSCRCGCRVVTTLRPKEHADGAEGQKMFRLVRYGWARTDLCTNEPV
jgi:hypothetical protein